jgi:hypothetical protein
MPTGTVRVEGESDGLLVVGAVCGILSEIPDEILDERYLAGLSDRLGGRWPDR